MKPEEIVTSLDWSKKLEKAGWHNETFLSWLQEKDGSWYLDNTGGYVFGRDSEPWYFAPTAEEVLRRLPKILEGKDKWNLKLTVTPYADRWSIDFLRHDGRHDPLSRSTTEDTLANAAAAMFCCLAEQKLLTPKE